MPFHLNPTTGEASTCRAQAGNCPFSAGSEHHETKAEAQLAYERIMAGKQRVPLSWLLSQRGQSLSGPEDSRTFVKGLHGEWENTKARLSEEQASQVHNYTQYGYERTNALLRRLPMPENRFTDPAEALQRTEDQIVVLDSVFEAEPVRPRTVYRYVDARDEAVADAVQRLREEGGLRDPAYVSTSASIDYPLHAVLENPDQNLFLLEMAIDRGVTIQPKPYHQPGHVQSMENEVLLPRDTRFEVAGIELKKKVSFGGMKEALLTHANMQHRRDRRKMENKPFHSVPVVKVVQVS